jgi:hypothetical protein
MIFKQHENQDILGLRKWSLDVFDGFDPYGYPQRRLIPEEMYKQMNNWCEEQLGYTARMGDYSVNFCFFEESHRTMFILRWS